jgi:hypothetical protein
VSKSKAYATQLSGSGLWRTRRAETFFPFSEAKPAKVFIIQELLDSNRVMLEFIGLYQGH